MPNFKYTAEDGRYYPSLGLEVEPGMVVERENAPAEDGRWIESGEPVSIAASPDPVEPSMGSDAPGEI